MITNPWHFNTVDVHLTNVAIQKTAPDYDAEKVCSRSKTQTTEIFFVSFESITKVVEILYIEPFRSNTEVADPDLELGGGLFCVYTQKFFSGEMSFTKSKGCPPCFFYQK